jgi:dethiobiotin synthetase
MSGMKRTTLFITGTDTGVGKTVLTALFLRYLRQSGVNAAALKPICSGSRDDARKIFAAMAKVQSPRSKAQSLLRLNEINPWYFRAPIAPLLAARRDKKSVELTQVLASLRATQKRFDVLLIEGAGGLLSPLGENFNSRDLITALRAMPVIVCPNRLGAVNQVLMTLEALPQPLRVKARVVLMSPPKPDAATGSNAKLLAEFCRARNIFVLPWLGRRFAADPVLRLPVVRRTLRALAAV